MMPKVSRVVSIMSMVRFFSVFFLVAAFTSCSLTYNSPTDRSGEVPEILIENAAFTRYENANPTVSLNAELLEQYKGKNAVVYGSGVSFSVKDSEGKGIAEGQCGYFSGNTETKVYNFFNDIIVKSTSESIEIRADQLKWLGDSGSLVSAKDSIVSVRRLRQGSESSNSSNFVLKGKGFQANTLKHSYVFAETVMGEILIDDEEAATPENENDNQQNPAESSG